ncbi:MAG TPA: hypothetical protein VEI97_08285 [bacterium]|nr:hypothetical protein [bacterium]
MCPTDTVTLTPKGLAYRKANPGPALKAEPVTNKKQMYALLARGAFGNTVPQFFDVDTWEESPEYLRYPTWGVRTLLPGGPCRLHCPRDEVRATAERPEYAAAGINISLMVDAACTVTLWAEVYDSDAGLVVYGVEHPPKGGSWRALMPAVGRHWHGTAARLLLARHLNPNSLDDLEALRVLWPGHVYELSACDTEIGTHPGRNAVVWEVRNY